METHFNTLVWRISRTAELGRLHSPRGGKELDATEVTKHACTQASFSLHDLPLKGQLPTVANQGREGMQGQIVQPCGRVLIPSQGISTTIFLSSSSEVKSPPNGKC